MEISRNELCEALSIDYADRATKGGLKVPYDTAYKQYLKRCEIRSYKDLLQQYTVQGLGTTKTLNGHRKVQEDWITTGDDDCEDGVCKL